MEKIEVPKTLSFQDYLLEVEKEAYLMIKKYGKERAKKEAILIAEGYVKDIKTLKYYNAEKINLWNKQKFFWLDVAKCIHGK